MSNFQPLEVVDRGSETQPQVVENLNKLTYTMRVNIATEPSTDFTCSTSTCDMLPCSLHISGSWSVVSIGVVSRVIPDRVISVTCSLIKSRLVPAVVLSWMIWLPASRGPPAQTLCQPAIPSVVTSLDVDLKVG